MKKILSLIIFLLNVSIAVFATHNRAGEITYTHVSALTYKIHIVTCTKISSPADRPVLDSVMWGDGSFSAVPRFDSVDDPAHDQRVNNYYATHTYSSPGAYEIYFVDPNRNAMVHNMTSSVNTAFCVKTLLVINPNLGYDDSPILSNLCSDRGCLGKIFIHNPSAYDPNGDSLSYELTQCLGTNGLPVSGYYFPYAVNSFGLDPQTGDLVWNFPYNSTDTCGEWNFAYRVNSYRKDTNGKWWLIGYVGRDIQIVIECGPCNNNPPEITPVPDLCVLAGDTIHFNVFATDPDTNSTAITLSASGGPFLVPFPAQFPTVTNKPAISTFHWNTKCEHVRNQPYHVEFHAEDNGPNVHLATFSGVSIKIVAPAPQGLTATPVNNSIQLQWSPDACSQAKGYKLYRRNGSYPGTIQCPCTTGVPAPTGYTLLKYLSGYNNVSFTDDNSGAGLVPGFEYCYRVTAIFRDSISGDTTESCASNEACAELRKDLPVITNVSVNTTNASTGSIYVAWSKPVDLDTVQFPPPYQFKVYHDSGFFATFPTLIATFNEPGFSSISDTTFTDTLIDTDTKPWSYYIEFYFTNSSGVLALKGKTQTASSVFLRIAPTDNRLNLTWEEHVPWTNTQYVVYRFNNSTVLFDSIGVSNVQSFSDTGLVNGVTYCYKIKSIGAYTAAGFIDPIINFSEEECGVPVDNVAPCPPLLTVVPDCGDHQNYLHWNNPNLSCADDVLKYNIYYSPTLDGGLELIATINSADDTTFLHSGLQSIAGCYLVTAVDSVGNESKNGNKVCVENCPQYNLPNIFTPDGDGTNDLFHPCDSTTIAPEQEICPPYQYIKDIDIKIFNRWGTLIFQTTDLHINWDGKNKDSKKDCPAGIYYYTCVVNEIYLNGVKPRTIKGFVHLIRKK